MEVLLISLFQVGSDRARLVFPTSPSLISGWSVGCRAIYFKSPVLFFVRLVAFSSSSAACLSSSWLQYVHRRGTSSSAERWKFSMHFHINTTISCSCGSARCLNVVFPTFDIQRSMFSFFATFYNNVLYWQLLHYF